MQPGLRQDRPRDARLSIPIGDETAAEYKARLATSFADPGTHVYIDTSFLMWATKIGATSRRELLTWLRGHLDGRAHVPTWAGHEYLRHHVNRTIVKDLVARSKEVSSLAGKTFGYFRPFLDDPAVGFDEASEELRSSTRNAVNMLGRLVAAASRWQRSYQSHSAEIIGYINETALAVSDLYDSVAHISREGLARYEGRLPPGFKDSGKRGDDAADDEGDHEEALPGANRFGDLIFWKEVLADAAGRGATAVIVLTNDLKNDWRMGGETSPVLDQAMLAERRSWRPVPRIHPMLVLEARTVGVNDLTLLDSRYFAAYLRDTAADVTSFADVAIVPDPPLPPIAADRREAAVERRLTEDERAADERTRDAGALGYRFPDDPLVKTSPASLARALFASRGPLSDRAKSLVSRLRADVGPAESIDAVITADALAGLDHLELVALTRTLHDKAVEGAAGYDEAVTDLVALLDELPPNTAGAMTLGFLASMFLEVGSGQSRIPPRSPASQLLLARLMRPEVAAAVTTIRRRVAGNAQLPVVLPDVSNDPLPTIFDIEPHATESDELRSLRINGSELLVAVQPDPSLQLATMLAGQPATRPRLLRHAADLFAIPYERLPMDDDGLVFALTGEIGFRSPTSVFRTKETADD